MFYKCFHYCSVENSQRVITITVTQVNRRDLLYNKRILIQDHCQFQGCTLWSMNFSIKTNEYQWSIYSRLISKNLCSESPWSRDGLTTDHWMKIYPPSYPENKIAPFFNVAHDLNMFLGVLPYSNSSYSWGWTPYSTSGPRLDHLDKIGSICILLLNVSWKVTIFWQKYRFIWRNSAIFEQIQI